MYRYFTRSPVVRQSAARFSQRLYSNATVRPQVNFNRKVKLISGLTATYFAYSYLNNTINNDTDVEKIEQELQEAITKTELEAQPETVVVTEETVIVEGGEEGGEEQEEVPNHEGAAYNPETGEINWDCPCLGGMAHGPCGEEFKEAFACFVYSETEPKGIDCIKKFEAMRSCFKRYPEHYKEELYDDGEEATPSAPIDETVEEQPVAIEEAK
ncbi:hypothetical protein DFJ63DRAFT_71859 [Scheffersomyces coipomensis]|uniref:uncharacterized protein n=1 Tax=Scheffersomyces coipomensis TaxID=1788519 RepID=UPI00315D08BE